MHRLRRNLSAAGLALVVMAMLTCAPTISRLLPLRAAGWIEICTSAGVRDVALPDDAQGIAPAKAPAQRHDPGAACAYCVLQAHQPMVAMAAPMVLPSVAVTAQSFVVDEIEAAPAERPLSTDQARAPPLFA